MKILVIGAGAIGGIVAAYLTKFNYEIQLVCKHRNIFEAIENNGLRVEGIRGSIITYPDTVIDLSQISNKPDLVLLATKATDVEEVCNNLLPYLKPETIVVSLQNGISEDLIASIIGKERTVGCVVSWGATMLNPGILELTSYGEFTIGELNGEITPRLKEIKSILEKVMEPVDISQNIFGVLYSKLIINSCTSILGVISGLYLGDMLKLKIARKIFLHIITEAVEVAKAANIKMEKIGGKLDPYRFALTEEESKDNFSFSLIKKHFMIRLIGLKYRRLKSSALQSLERGKKTEIDYLNGYILAKAKQTNVSVPVNQRLVSMVKDIELGKLKIHRDNLNNILD